MYRNTVLPSCLTAILLLAACMQEGAPNQDENTQTAAVFLPPKIHRKTPAYVPPPAVLSAASEPPSAAVTAALSVDGMHSVCAAYFDSAAACFAQAPEAQRGRLLASLDNSRAELQTADENTCLLIQNQFDDWKRQVNC